MVSHTAYIVKFYKLKKLQPLKPTPSILLGEKYNFSNAILLLAHSLLKDFLVYKFDNEGNIVLQGSFRQTNIGVIFYYPPPQDDAT